MGEDWTATALVDLMQRSGWAKRVLFLVDRRELRAQALGGYQRAFGEPSVYPNPDDKGFPLDRRIYVQTYHTMLNMLHKQEDYVSPFFFDLVIMDEAHRLFNTFKEIITTLTVQAWSCTATKDKVHASSYKLFNCDDDQPTYDYGYAQGVKDNFLRDYEVLSPYWCSNRRSPKAKTSHDQQEELMQQGIDPDDFSTLKEKTSKSTSPTRTRTVRS